MRTGINHPFIPGPTNVPEPARQAMNMPMLDHHAPDVGEPNIAFFRDLKRLFRTGDGHVLLFPGSGTGAWEAAITNTLNPGDRVLNAGKVFHVASPAGRRMSHRRLLSWRHKDRGSGRE